MLHRISVMWKKEGSFERRQPPQAIYVPYSDQLSAGMLSGREFEHRQFAESANLANCLVVPLSKSLMPQAWKQPRGANCRLRGGFYNQRIFLNHWTFGLIDDNYFSPPRQLKIPTRLFHCSDSFLGHSRSQARF